MSGFEKYADLKDRPGKHKTSKSCLDIKCLSDVDQDVLRDRVMRSVDHMIKPTT